MSMFPDAMRGVSKHLLTPLVRPFAGKFLLAVVHHVGRTSHKPYATPLIVRQHNNLLFIALTYGPQTDWCRNVMAAGECRIELHGHIHQADQPTIVARTAALRHFTVVERAILQFGGVQQFLQLCDEGIVVAED